MMQKLSVRLPQTFEKAIGYDGRLRWAAFYWEPCGDEAVFDDGFCSGDGNWDGFLALVDHPNVSPLLSGYNLGSSEEEAEHWLLADLVERDLYVGQREEIHRFVIEQAKGAIPQIASQVEITPQLHREIFQNILAKLKSVEPPSMEEEIEKLIREEQEAIQSMVAELSIDERG